MSFERRSGTVRRIVVTALALGAVAVAGSAVATAATEKPQQTKADGLAAARAVVKQAQAPLKFVAPGPAFQPTNYKGKTVYLIPNYLAGSTFWQNGYAGLRAAGKMLGVKVVGLDPRFSISEAARLIDQAVGRHADAIIIGSLPSAALAAPIRAAVKAGIPVIVEGETPAATKKYGVFGVVNTDYHALGRVLAAYGVVSTNGKLNTVAVQSPEIPDNRFQNDGYVAGVKEFCPSCKLTVKNVPLAQWSTQLGPAATAIAADSSVNVTAPVWCDMAPFMITAIHASAASNLKIICQGANAQDLGLLKKGDVITGIDTTPDPQWGWNGMDQVLRAWSGEKPATGLIPLRLITKENMASVDPKDLSTWYGKTLNLAEGFKKVWGLQ